MPCALAHSVKFTPAWYDSNVSSLCMAHMLGSCSRPYRRGNVGKPDL